MAKIVKTVIEVGVGIGLMALSGGLAGIGIAGVMSAGTLATAVTGLGLGLALMGTETLVTKTPSFSNSLSDRLSMNYDTTAPRAIVFGTTAADTALRFKETYGKDNDRLALVIANASHRLSAVKAIYLDSVLSYSGGLTGKYSSGIERLQPVLEGTATNGSATGTGSPRFRSRSNSRFRPARSSVTSSSCVTGSARRSHGMLPSTATAIRAPVICFRCCGSMPMKPSRSSSPAAPSPRGGAPRSAGRSPPRWKKSRRWSAAPSPFRLTRCAILYAR